MSNSLEEATDAYYSRMTQALGRRPTNKKEKKTKRKWN